MGINKSVPTKLTNAQLKQLEKVSGFSEQQVQEWYREFL
ncbi:unnamed protein product, partial [Didymodactylos carnosus]